MVSKILKSTVNKILFCFCFLFFSQTQVSVSTSHDIDHK